MKKIVAALIVMAAVVAAAIVVMRNRSAAAAAPTTATETAQVERGDIFQSVASTGQVVSNLDVDIKCRASGEVVKLPFDISQKVKAGDLLVQLDPVDEQRMVDQARVRLAQSQARREQSNANLRVAEQTLVTNRQKAQAMLDSATVRSQNAQAQLQRQQDLLTQNLGSRADLETAQTNAAQAAADLATAKVAIEDLKTQELAIQVKRQDVVLAQEDVKNDQLGLENAQRQLEYTTVVAPMDGVVSAQNIQKGTIISSAISNVGGGTTVMTLSDLSRIFVLASVDESDIGQVKLGQKALITADAYRGTKFEGEVVRIATKGVNVSNVVTFEVKIELTSANKDQLKPMMTTNVQLIEVQRDGVLLVPSRAIQRKDDQLVAEVVGPDGKAVTRPVELGLMDGERWEVLSGLNEGEVVQLQKTDSDQSRWSARRGPNLFGGAGGAAGARRGGGGAH